MSDSDLDLKEFTGRSTPAPNQPLVTIQRKGLFSMNRAARDLLGESDDLHAILLYDEKRKVIAIRRADNAPRHAYPIRRQTSSDTYLIAGQAFCSHNHIPADYTRRYAVHAMNEPAPTLIVDLNSEELPAQRGRRNGQHDE